MKKYVTLLDLEIYLMMFASFLKLTFFRRKARDKGIGLEFHEIVEFHCLRKPISMSGGLVLFCVWIQFSLMFCGKKKKDNTKTKL